MDGAVEAQRRGRSKLRPYKELLKADQDNFGGGADAQGRTPRAGAAGGVNEEIAEALEAVGVGAEDARGEPGEGEYLAAVRGAGARGPAAPEWAGCAERERAER